MTTKLLRLAIKLIQWFVETNGFGTPTTRNETKLKTNNMANLEVFGLKKSKRSIDKIFIHCSATPEGREHDVEDIRLWHTSKGWRDVGYHYVVKLDGTVEEGRSINLDGAHARGHNEGSIAVCYIGGLTKSGKTPKDTRTQAQIDSLHELLTNLSNVYPKATLHGHNEFANKACPSFDVQSEYYYIINKTVKQQKMVDDFETEGGFADFIDELTNDEKNDNACSIDNPDCEGCGS
jgi:N-acetylmuramoyl-L-alanine amidase